MKSCLVVLMMFVCSAFLAQSDDIKLSITVTPIAFRLPPDPDLNTEKLQGLLLEQKYDGLSKEIAGLVKDDRAKLLELSFGLRRATNSFSVRISAAKEANAMIIFQAFIPKSLEEEIYQNFLASVKDLDEIKPKLCINDVNLAFTGNIESILGVFIPFIKNIMSRGESWSGFSGFISGKLSSNIVKTEPTIKEAKEDLAPQDSNPDTSSVVVEKSYGLFSVFSWIKTKLYSVLEWIWDFLGIS